MFEFLVLNTSFIIFDKRDSYLIFLISVNPTNNLVCELATPSVKLSDMIQLSMKG